MLLLEEMNQDQVASLEFASAVAVLAISPLEEHGPHLPVGTDLLLSTELAREAISRAEERWPHLTFVQCPPIPIGAEVVRGAGSISVPKRIVHDVVFSHLRGLSRSGFRYAILCSAHGSLGHVVALEEAAERAGRQLGMRVESVLSAVLVPFLTGKLIPAIEARLGHPLADEERDALRWDVHGGQWETGAMLLARPDLVQEGYRELPGVPFRNFIQLREAMAQSCARGLGYVGSPAHATPEYARAARDVLLERIFSRLDRMLHGPDFRPSHTPFYFWPGFRTAPTYPLPKVARLTALTFLAGAAVGAASLTAVLRLRARKSGE